MEYVNRRKGNEMTFVSEEFYAGEDLYLVMASMPILEEERSCFVNCHNFHWIWVCGVGNEVVGPIELLHILCKV